MWVNDVAFTFLIAFIRSKTGSFLVLLMVAFTKWCNTKYFKDTEQQYPHHKQRWTNNGFLDTKKLPQNCTEMQYSRLPKLKFFSKRAHPDSTKRNRLFSLSLWMADISPPSSPLSDVSWCPSATMSKAKCLPFAG